MRSTSFDDAFEAFLRATDGVGADSNAGSDDVDIDIEVVADVDAEIDGRIAARIFADDVVQLDDGPARIHEAVTGGASMTEITRLVERDPPLAQCIARLARSPAFTGAVGERISLPYAVMRLGAQGVRGVCLMSALATHALRPGPLLTLRRNVWRECVASALTCQALAGSHGVRADDAWLAGLFHDYGKIVALIAIEPDVDARHASAWRFWSDVMERHHCDVGWIVTDRWKLPPGVPYITATHHQPGDGRGLHEVVVCGDRIVRAAAGRGWQIAAADIAALEGVEGDDQAMAIRIALARHPYFLAAVA